MPLRVGRRLAQLQQRKAVPIEPASLAADLIYFRRKYTVFTNFYEFMLQKVLKLPWQCSFKKLCFFAPIIPKIRQGLNLVPTAGNKVAKAYVKVEVLTLSSI